MTDIEQYGLGRIHAPDARDKVHRMRALLPPVTRTSRHWTTGSMLPLNQGQTGTCVGHAWRALLYSSPARNVINDPTAFAIYLAAIKADEWTDNDNDTAMEFGTSVRAGAKVLTDLGFISAYVWAWSGQTAEDWVLTNGPVVMGTTWTQSMFTPDKKGFIFPDGNPVGGHSYLVVGCNRKMKCPDGSVGAVRILNSWGRDWGQLGRAWLSSKAFDELIKDSGEACTATEVLKK